MGARLENCIARDSSRVIYKGRKTGINQWKSAHAADTGKRSLAEALIGADVFLGLSANGTLTPETVARIADKPVIFAMANPDPEIDHEAARVLNERAVDFEYDGELTVGVALNDEVSARFPFCKLTGLANILVVPARHTASISVNLLQEVAGATAVGPILSGVDAQVQLCSFTTASNDIFNMAVTASCNIG